MSFLTPEEVERRADMRRDPNHQPGCHHQRTLREGVEAFLASARTRDALELTLAALAYPSLSPESDADRVLASLAGVVEQLGV